MLERRKHQRRRTLKAGEIILNDRASLIACTIRNISAGGACLELGPSIQIPNIFDLNIPSSNLLKPCQIAWRSVDRVGVAFR